MRITFVLPDANLSGGVRVVAIYAELLTRRGHDVLVVSTPASQPSFLSKTKSFLKGHGWPGHRSPNFSHLENRNLRHRVIEAYRPITDADLPDADVVIATWWETAEWVARLSPSKGAKAYFLQHHEVFDHLPADRVSATWRLPFHKIVVAQWLAELARERYGDPHASLVPNSVDLEQFNAPPRGKQLFPTVGMMYSTVGFKGCDIAIKAVELARKEIPNLRVVAFGASLPAMHLPLPLQTDYTLCPAQDRIKDQYSRCDAWLVASRSEGFGLPILEAMACRTPVIATPTGAAPELISGGGGLLVAAEDPVAMARAIVQICSLSGDAWTSMSSAAYATANSYTWDQAADKFEAALELAIQRCRCEELPLPGHSPSNRL